MIKNKIDDGGPAFTEDEVMTLLMRAYVRGFEWCIANGADRDFVQKAAGDYADYTLSARSSGGASDAE